MALKILYIAEIVGKTGIWCIKNALPQLKEIEKPDLIVANGDGTTGGWGLGKQHAGYLRKLGIEVITGGDCTYYKKDLVENIDSLPYVLRPVNYPPESPGRGWRFFNASNKPVAILSMLGMTGFNRNHAENPFTSVQNILEKIRQESPFILIDFHANATAEKQAFFYHVDGLVSAVIGSHTRVQTADERILSKGTGVITDAGRTGSLNSVVGIDANSKIKEYITRMPEWTKEAWENPVFQGLVIELDEYGKTTHIKRINHVCPNPPQ